MSDLFNETSLRADIVQAWGAHGAHVEVFDHMLGMIESLRKANAAQRDQIIALNERLHSKTIIVKADLHGDAAQIAHAIQQMEGGQ